MSNGFINVRVLTWNPFIMLDGQVGFKAKCLVHDDCIAKTMPGLSEEVSEVVANMSIVNNGHDSSEGNTCPICLGFCTSGAELIFRVYPATKESV